MSNIKYILPCKIDENWMSQIAEKRQTLRAQFKIFTNKISGDMENGVEMDLTYLK